MKVNLFDDLLAQVHPHTDVPSGVKSALTGIALMFEEKKEDPAAIQALCDDLRTSADAFGGHICAGTEVAPPGEKAGRLGPDRRKEAEESVPHPHTSPALGAAGVEAEDEGKHPHAKHGHGKKS